MWRLIFSSVKETAMTVMNMRECPLLSDMTTTGTISKRGFLVDQLPVCLEISGVQLKLQTLTAPATIPLNAWSGLAHVNLWARPMLKEQLLLRALGFMGSSSSVDVMRG
jgi:hypothetical protein